VIGVLPPGCWPVGVPAGGEGDAGAGAEAAGAGSGGGASTGAGVELTPGLSSGQWLSIASCGWTTAEAELA
jgi:hypothetical protein